MTEEIDPWGNMPQVGKEVPDTLEAYQAEVKAGKTYLTDPAKWKAVGWNPPFINTGSYFADHAKASELLEQGLPCFLNYGGDDWQFTIKPMEVIKAEVEAYEKEAFEIASEEAYWAKNPNRLKSVTDMLKTPEIDWMVEDKIHRTGLFQLFGESYAGKTVLMLDLVMSWCAGLTEWQGYRLNNGGKPQDALYVAAEGGAAVSIHVDAWIKYHQLEPSCLDGLVFLDGGDGDHVFLSIDEKKKKKKDEDDVPFEDSWARLYKEVTSKGLNPSVVVFDTQIDISPGADENSNSEMVGILRKIKRLGDSNGFMAIVIHHTGHDGNKARGASGMKGKCDAQAKLEVMGSGTGKAKLSWTKVKGRGTPKDTISYHIQGYEFLPDLDSEGAVCVPITNKDASRAYTTQEHALAGKIAQILSVRGKRSARELSDELKVGRNSKEFKDMIAAMIDGGDIVQVGKGPTAGYEISSNFHEDIDPDA